MCPHRPQSTTGLARAQLGRSAIDRLARSSRLNTWSMRPTQGPSVAMGCVRARLYGWVSRRPKSWPDRVRAEAPFRRRPAESLQFVDGPTSAADAIVQGTGTSRSCHGPLLEVRNQSVRGEASTADR